MCAWFVFTWFAGCGGAGAGTLDMTAKWEGVLNWVRGRGNGEWNREQGWAVFIIPGDEIDYLSSRGSTWPYLI